MFPGPTTEYEEALTQYGDVSVLPTVAFLYGLDADAEVHLDESHLVLLGIEAISEPDARGMRTVVGTINGQLRPTRARDQAVESTATSAERADPADSTHVAVPFAGVVTSLVAEGDTVEAGQTIATIEAMKMEASITAPTAGTVRRLGWPQPVRLRAATSWPSSTSPLRRYARMAVGTVHSFDPYELRGVIVDDDGWVALPIYPSSFVGNERSKITIGERVAFDVLPGASGLVAENVRRV